MDETHDPQRTSWVPSAQAETDFPIQNLPFGIFRRRADDDPARVGVAIGDQILDLAACHDEGWFSGLAEQAGDACASATLNPLMALGAATRAALRRQAGALLAPIRRPTAPTAGWATACWSRWRRPSCCCPRAIGDYTDFYASVHHATNVGSMFRPDNPLLPNYKWVPIGYHGRASSIVVSGTPVRRPQGQIKAPDADGAVVRAEPVARLRAGGGLLRRAGQPARRADPDRRRPRSICSASAW